MTVHRGAGAYICGEETAMLNSLEGKRGEPRLKPPFPAVEGLYRKPTIVNNVETLAYLVPILERGAEWFAAVGTERSKGYKIVSVSGHVRNPGNYEIALGTTVREIIELAGGLRPGRKLMAVQPGGGSSACIFEEQLDWPYDYESMAKAGSMLGSGAFVVFDDTTDFVNAAYNLVRFFAHESCGQCTPCREGGSWMERVLERLVHRRGVAGDDEMLLRVSSAITGLNLCPLGDSIEPFLKSVMQRFPEQFKARIAAVGGFGMSAPLLAPGTQMVNLTIDGVPVTVPKGTLLVEAAKTIQQQIPIYCYHTKLGPAGLCRICVVEIEGTPKLQIACNTAAAEGMVVRTCGEKVDAARAMVLELFLVNHPLDCPICDKGGECDLQDYAMAYARGTSDVADPKLSKPKAVDLGPTIVLDEERCIVCQRCVRFDDIIADERQLVVKDRGARDIIATATGRPIVITLRET